VLAAETLTLLFAHSPLLLNAGTILNYCPKTGVHYKEPVWENITIYIKLRNIMVHADGEITNNTKKEVINFLKVHQFYFAINPMNKIEIESGFIQLVVKDMERFISKLTRRIEKQIT
jgi:hypothetical protein